MGVLWQVLLRHVTNDESQRRFTLRFGGTKEIGDPYTKYAVSVTENMKGNLMTEKAIPIVKYGGVSEDGKTCYLFDGDELPVAGNTYIFFAYAQDDGSLLISGPVSNVQVDNEDAVRARGNTITYEDVKDACQNQIDSGRERSASIYEAR
ncbi:MAG: hypothetical protein HFH23_10885 [Ruminococcus sp.]|nr:hypothetical protein [Ruminococcus sp.]